MSGYWGSRETLVDTIVMLLSVRLFILLLLVISDVFFNRLYDFEFVSLGVAKRSILGDIGLFSGDSCSDIRVTGSLLSSIECGKVA